MPGGLLQGSRLARSATFRPLTGRVEQALLEVPEGLDNPPRFVTVVLAAAMESIGGKPVGAEQMTALCVADRQFLMLRLAGLLDGDLLWLTTQCRSCSAPFDIEVSRCSPPVKRAGAGYPVATVDLQGRQVRLRVPTGADQEQIVFLEDEQALRELLICCLVAEDGMAPSSALVDGLSEADIQAIEDALEEASPAVVTRLLAHCPECAHEQIVTFDPYSLVGAVRDTFYQEVHNLALTYHWSEAEILALPRERRRLYLRLTDRARGMYD